MRKIEIVKEPLFEEEPTEFEARQYFEDLKGRLDDVTIDKLKTNMSVVEKEINKAKKMGRNILI